MADAAHPFSWLVMGIGPMGGNRFEWGSLVGRKDSRRPVVCLVNISLLQECKAIGIAEEAGHVLFPDVIEQDSGGAFLYKPGFPGSAERIVVDVQLILVVDGVEIVHEKVFYFILPDDTVRGIRSIFIIIVDKHIDCLPVGIAEAKGVEP